MRRLRRRELKICLICLYKGRWRKRIEKGRVKEISLIKLGIWCVRKDKQHTMKE